jgi:hypothetical protein
MCLAQNNDVVQALALDRSDQPFGNEEPAIVVRKVGSASHLPLQNHQLMSKYRILSFKPALRLEWRGQHGQNEVDQRYHCANLADSVT